jgi:hypothetical protein
MLLCFLVVFEDVFVLQTAANEPQGKLCDDPKANHGQSGQDHENDQTQDKHINLVIGHVFKSFCLRANGKGDGPALPFVVDSM